MSGHRWMLDERLCLDILHTEFENTKADNHTLFGRIFGQRWEDADRSPYTAQRLYEEHRWRWNPAKSKDWDRICIPPTLRTGQQQAERDQMLQRIVAAAAQSGTNNFFTDEVDAPITLNAPAVVTTPAETSPTLQMVHTCLVDLAVFPPTYTQRNVSRFIPRESRLYKYGGHVKRVVEGNKTLDVMICTKSVCLLRQNYHRDASVSEHNAKALAARAENADLMIPGDSPLGGLPFVHVWRDCDRDAEPNQGERYTFSPIPPKPTIASELQTWISEIAFDDSQNGTEEGDGCAGYRRAGLCDPFHCDVCRISDERAAELLSGQGPSAPA
ncbi:hypothetical protein M409DRAFT_22169 [Zasmidium cellare ATCC 36951]|uniref:Uncharacterized protein n=1 Tax=Zasmidium cellare ATCC 36951 TaxID=1080233 RepID=A0A6A6CNQ0_ZASCE|nr:uncharacterized protein M409DRAFT_22169 [Zasmidium cellare ATCC 36951]KAF2167359.1 hypothetical protein M409DRAFT_22169 [Zasmidium cellare ATCC 36951]